MNREAGRPTSAAAARALVMQPQDNVATALCALALHEQVQAQGSVSSVPVVLREPIALCHKFALRPIAQGEVVVKYGEPIGTATCAIAAGDHVHIHNLTSARAR